MQTMPWPATARLVLVACLVNFSQFTNAKLLLTYYVHRYGVRNVLPKSALLSESNATGGPALLPVGRQQNHEAGMAFRQRYLLPTTCKRTSTCLGTNRSEYGIYGRDNVEYNNYNTLVRSSGLDRTISAANAFISGMFPVADNPAVPDPNQALPVYSFTDSEDWLIRAYTKCPRYNSRLQEWYASAEFEQRERESQELRGRIAALDPTLNTSLTAWWNVYDAFNIFQNYGFGNVMPRLDNATFTEVVDLAYWLEATKMHYRLTSSMLGGPMLADLLKYMGDAVAHQDKVYYKLLGISGHYNVLMAIPSALGLDEGATGSTYPWKDRIPPFASLLVFELHADDANPRQQYVRAVYQQGAATAYKTMPLPCARPGDPAHTRLGPGACTYAAFVDLAAPRALATAAEWCAACQNTGVEACKVYWSGAGTTVKAKRQHTCKWDETTTIVVSVLASVAGTVLLMLASLALVRRLGRHKHSLKAMHDLQALGLDTAPASSAVHMTAIPAGRGPHV